jgi:hypothetical protein
MNALAGFVCLIVSQFGSGSVSNSDPLTGGGECASRKKSGDCELTGRLSRNKGENAPG